MLLFIYILAAIGTIILLIGSFYTTVTSEKEKDSTLLSFLWACGFCLDLPLFSNLTLDSTIGNPIWWRVLTCCALFGCICEVIHLYNASKKSIHAITIDIKSDKEISEEILNEICKEIKKDERIKMVALQYSYIKKM